MLFKQAVAGIRMVEPHGNPIKKAAYVALRTFVSSFSAAGMATRVRKVYIATPSEFDCGSAKINTCRGAIHGEPRCICAP